MISILILNVFQRFSIQAVERNRILTDSILSRDYTILSQFFIVFRIPTHKTFTFLIFLRRFGSSHTTLNKCLCFLKSIRTNKREIENTSTVFVFSIDGQIRRHVLE